MANDFDTLWQSLPLAVASGQGIALDATITSRTFAAQRDAPRVSAAAPIAFERTAHADPDPKRSASDSDLPRISIAISSRTSVPGAVRPVRAAGGADIEITALLGEGGMGRVHLAHQRSLDRDIAIKVIKPEITDASAVAEALVSEAVITGFLEHPNIIPVHALGRDDSGRPVLVMKRIDGVAWRDLLRDPAHTGWIRLLALSADRLAANLEIVMQVANALHFAHSRGVIHRDVKPENIMIGEFGEVYLVDWGIALRLADIRGKGQETQTASQPGTREPALALVGTPAYMAPEMVACRTAAVGERTDVYLLGATLHEVLTGHARHQGETFYMVLAAACESQPYEYAASVPAELALICNKATSADPDKRHASALEFRQSVAEFIRHRGSVALGESADRALEQLEAMLAKGVAADDANLHRVMTECRFGYINALNEWSDNAPARRGLQRCLEVTARHEISRGNATAARSLLAEFPEPRPEILALLLALEATAQTTRDREARLQKIERDLDVSVSSRPRALLFVAIALAAGGISIFDQTSRNLGGGITPEQLLLFMSGLLATLLVGTAVARKQLLANAINRRIVTSILFGVTAMLSNRIMAVHLGTATHAILAVDSLLLAFMCAQMGLTILRWVGWIAPMFVASAFASVWWPKYCGTVFTISTAASFAVAGVFWKQRAEKLD